MKWEVGKTRKGCFNWDEKGRRAKCDFKHHFLLSRCMFIETFVV